MTNIIGPIDKQTWKTMRLLKGSIRFYEEKKDPLYDEVKGKQQRWLKEYYKEVLTNRAA